MLKNIPAILSPEAVKLLMEMGHGDTVLLADANYPAHTNNDRVVRADGHTIPDLLEAVLTLLPLDTVVERPASVMATGTDESPAVWTRFSEIVCSAGGPAELEQIERFRFYEVASHSAGVIQSGDTTLFGNILLQKGTLQ